MMTLYHKSRPGTDEEAFFECLKSEFPATPHIDMSYIIDTRMLNTFVKTETIRIGLQEDKLLPPTRRNRSLKMLEKCPDLLRVALTPIKIQPDIVAEVRGQLFFWEFHEHQHRDLTVGRPSSVYTPEEERINVPRYLQRFIRDIWKIAAWDNYTIVWWDWFANNAPKFRPHLATGFHEYSESDRFSFAAFLGTRNLS